LGSTGGAALRGVSLALARGEYVAVVGPSGSGKALLIAVLACLRRPDEGRHWLDGRRVDRLPAAERARLRGRRIGLLLGNPLLVPELSALENVEVPLVYRRLQPAPCRARPAGVLGALGLGSRLGRRPCELSPSERRRVELARACVGEPELLLAHEPTRGLDARAGDELMDLLELRSALGVTVVVATQDAARGRRARR